MKNTKFYRSLSNNSGMTLIEIMIVIAIIAGITTALIGNVMGNRDNAQIKQASIKMSAIGKAIEMYSLDCNDYPESLDDLTEEPSSCDSWGPQPYIKAKKNVFNDPWGNDFIYERDGGSYTLLSLGKDKREGGEGINEDIIYDE